MTVFGEVLRHVITGLKLLTTGVEELQRKVEDLEGEKPSLETHGKLSPQAETERTISRETHAAATDSMAEDISPSAGTTATALVFNIIASSEEGVTTAQIIRKTGFTDRKIWKIVTRLKKQGKVKSAQRGLYVKA